MAKRSLAQWLAWQERLHPTEIELGLERVRLVAQKLHPLALPFPVITVGGTNGKGSCVAFLEAILAAAGYRVGAYTSPHLIHYNERVRLAGAPVSDDDLCDAFERVDEARDDVSLTYFEFGTLAAVDIFHRRGVDAAILEVGLGGRLDAVNVYEPEAALVTTVALDHMAWLGPDREAIGREKAGIFRPGKPAVCGEFQPPASLVQHAAQIGARLLLPGRDYQFRAEADGTWTWWCDTARRTALPEPSLRGEFQMRNAAAVLAVLHQLRERLPVSQADVRHGLLEAALPGRFQVIAQPVTQILDVAHNPQAAAALAQTLASRPWPGRTLAVFSALADKDLSRIVAPLVGLVDAWYLAPLPVPRAADVDAMRQALDGNGAGQVAVYANMADAHAAAVAECAGADRVVVFGSFYTVGTVLELLSSRAVINGGVPRK